MDSPLEIERVEWLPWTPEVLEVRVSGRWGGAVPREPVELVVDAAGVRRRLRSTGAEVDAAGLWQASFAVPVELRSSLAAHLALQSGDRELALPAALPGPADGTPAPPPATVVDPGVLASMRARRENQADEGLLRRAQAAEATAATLETQLGHVEVRLRDALAEHDRAGARLRAAEQGAEAERRVRSEVQEERVAAQAQAERDVRALRERVRAAEEHAAALAGEMDAIRREGAEAQQAAAAARAAAERAIRGATADGGAEARREIERLRADAASLSGQLAGERRSRAAAEADLARQASRVAEVQATVSRLEGELARRGDVQRGVRDEIASLREALERVRAQAEAQAVQGSGARAALEELKTVAAGLRERIEELEHAERVARAAARQAGDALEERTRELSRASMELERLRTELSVARAADEARVAAVREAERAVEAARRQAAELQVRLDDETRRRFEAEAALRVELQREREAFGAEVAAAEREVAARIAAEREAYEEQATEIERLVGDVRATLALAGEQLGTRLEEAERRRDGALAERDAAIAERDAALAGVEATKREIAAELQDASAERVELGRRLAEAEASVAEARESVARARHAAEAEMMDAGADLARQLTDAEAARDALSAQVAARDEELARLRALVDEATRGEDELGRLVEAVAERAGAVAQGFERAVAGLAARIDAETGGLRAELDAERRARWVAEQELAAERARGAEGVHAAVADSLARTELESMRRDLAAAQEQLAGERARSAEVQEQREAATRVVADLGAAESRLKQREPIPPDDEPSPPDAPEPVDPTPIDPAAAAPAAAIDPAAAGEPAPFEVAAAGRSAPTDADADAEPTPLATRIAPAAGRRTTPWLARSLRALSRTDPDAAAALFLALIPAQGGLLRDPLTYALLVDDHGAYRVDVRADGATVEPRSAAEASEGTQVTVGGAIEMLAPLAAGDAPRRLRGVRIGEGRRRKLRKLVKARRAPLDLAELARRGIELPPAPLLAALAAAVEPAWTAGHAFSVRYDVTGAETVDVVVPSHGRPTVRRAGAGEHAPGPDARTAATVTLPAAALPAVLARTDLPAGTQPLVSGDPHTAAILHSWFDRAQGIPGG
ncbi:hypothetical protein DSM104329_02624 [Capillimicrobium parvum]|uniref:Uncharacterized protein n=2 Tax=Capillimicrobium parvum TaxID=2884022 RepID=A0A9E7C125_9ACTN|nr:hypothetical protein DSM104329_02624 [Capillimicrobium parvum]